MKKFLFLVLAGLFHAVWLSAGAATFTGGTITLVVPEGWEASDSGKKDGSEVRLSSPDNAYRLLVSFYPSEGRSGDEWSKEIAGKLGIESLAQTRVPGLYTSASPNSPIRVALTASESRLLVILESGNSMRLGADIIDILSSLKSTVPEEQKLFHTLKWLFVGTGVRQKE